jgi:GNAT superfamily N-acetyltransferase
VRDGADVAEEVIAALDPARYARLADDPADVRAFLDHDLASLVENRLGVLVDPRVIGEDERAQWVERATEERRQHRPDFEWQRPLWLIEDGERVGTIAVWPVFAGGTHSLVTSLYVRPDRRGRGIARRALDEIASALTARGLGGLKLETSWTWTRTLAFYAHLGLWVRMWKRELQLVLDPRLARYEVRFDGDVARLSWQIPERDVAHAIVAERHGDRLRILAAPARSDAGEEGWLSEGTFAMHLALRGWPLIESDEAWAKQLAQGWSDGGDWHGLAFRIRRWEAWAARCGWRCDAPRIPGLDYPRWAALIAE